VDGEIGEARRQSVDGVEVRDPQRHAGDGRSDAERDNDRVDIEDDDQNAVEEAHRARHRDGDPTRHPGVEAVPDGQQRDERPGNAHQSGDGEVELPHTEGDDEGKAEEDQLNG